MSDRKKERTSAIEFQHYWRIKIELKIKHVKTIIKQELCLVKIEFV